MLERTSFSVVPVALILGLSTAAALSVTAPSAAEAAVTTPVPAIMQEGMMTVPASDDAYVVRDAPLRNTGSSTKLVASAGVGMDKTTYVKFNVPAPPPGTSIASARIEVSALRGASSTIRLHPVGSSWSETTIDQQNAPVPGAATGATDAPLLAGGTASLNVSEAVQWPGAHSFALQGASGTSALLSKESGPSGPRLVMTWKRTAITLLGATVWSEAGETYATALQQANAVYGDLEVIRKFYGGLPAAWPTMGTGSTPVNVSFKGQPQDIIAGRYDVLLRDWFATAPTDRPTWWTYYHEPEDNIADGSFTAEQYRAAWRHLDDLADAAANPQLRSTLVLMCWSLDVGSGRDWKDYYAGSDVIDVLGWDCYNLDAKRGGYRSPADIFTPVARASASVGKPWAVSEFGSLMVAGDDGTRRGAWLRDSATYLRSQGAQFVAYFDAPVGLVTNPEYRLLDAPSQAAWRWAVSGS